MSVALILEAVMSPVTLRSSTNEIPFTFSPVDLKLSAIIVPEALILEAVIYAAVTSPSIVNN